MPHKVLAAAFLCAPALSAAALPAGNARPTDSLAHWKAYAQSRIAPRYDWAQMQRVAPPSVVVEATGLFATSTSLAGSDWTALPQLELNPGQVSGVAAYGAVDRSHLLAANALWTADYSSASLTRSLGSNGALSLSAIVAHQRFATPGFGAVAGQPSIRGVVTGPALETSDGYGARFALDRALGDGRVLWNITVQSRMAMDAFKAYRGVFSEVGDFDIPGFVQTGVGYRVSPRIKLSADVQQVLYSEVPTFASAALPTRFLSLLGNGTSPRFAWRDLTVYEIEASVADDSQGQWSLRWSSQQTPRPTSEILDRALSKLYSDSNFALAYQRSIAGAGQLRLATSYAPESYFLAAAPRSQRGFDGQRQLEFEAQWMLDF